MKLRMTLVAPFLLWPALAAAQEPPAPPAMSLRDAVNYALEHAPDLKLSQAEVRRREGGVTSAHAGLMPQVDLAADAAWTHLEHGYPLGATPSTLRFDTALFTGAADAKWMVWDFHRTQLELDAAREQVEAASAGVDRRRQELVFDTARLYLQTLAYTDLIEAADARAASLGSLLDRTNQLVAAGRGVPVDAPKIQTRLAEVESSLATLRAGRRSSLSALAAVMGFEGDLPTLTYAAASQEQAPPPAAERDALRDAAASRPELASQDHEIRAAEHAEAAAHQSAWPRIDLRAAVVQYGSDDPMGFAQFISKLLPAAPANVPAVSSAATDWLLGVHVSMPLFDGGRRKGRILAAAAQAEEARLVRQQLSLRVAREVRTALADLESAQSRVRSLHDSVAEGERVLHDERLKYEAGRSVINFVLDAESALLTSQSLLSQAERSVTTATLALDLATGRIDVIRLPDSP